MDKDRNINFSLNENKTLLKRVKNSEFFMAEYNQALEKIKEVNKDVYFKEKIHILEDKIKNQRCFISKSKLVEESNENSTFKVILHSLENINIVYLIELVFFILVLILYYTFNKEQNISIISKIDLIEFNWTSLFLFFIIFSFLIAIAYFLYKIYTTESNNKVLLAEKIVNELISHNSETLIDLDYIIDRHTLNNFSVKKQDLLPYILKFLEEYRIKYKLVEKDNFNHSKFVYFYK